MAQQTADGPRTGNGASGGVGTLVAPPSPPAPTHVAGTVTTPAAPPRWGPGHRCPRQPRVRWRGQPSRCEAGAARVVSNMTTSLEVPTATSFRVVPAKLLEVNRLILNNQLARTGTAGKVSFTHLIGWAVVQAVQAVPAINSSFAAPAGEDGDNAPDNNANANHPSANKNATPAVFRPAHVNLGIAVDLERPDGNQISHGARYKTGRHPRFPPILAGLRGARPQGAFGKGRRERLRRRRP